MSEVALDVVVEAGNWDVSALRNLASPACNAVAQKLDLPPDCEVVLMACDDARIAVLNAEFRGKPVATNVLSWPAQDLGPLEDGGAPAPPEADFPGEGPTLGDIALAYETCVAEANESGKPLDAHLTHLVIHGMLHLLGYDHVREGDALRMETLEIEILDAMGLANPYE